MTISEKSKETVEAIFSEPPADDRLEVYIGPGYNIPEAAGKAFAALLATNDPPVVFIRGAVLVEAIKDPKTGVPVIRNISEDILAGELAKVCKFFTYAGKDDHPSERAAPKETIKFILLNMHPWTGVPVLDMVTACPIIDLSSGAIRSTPGYDPALLAIYAPTEELAIKVPEAPTAEDVAGALAAIEDVLADFPFVDESDRANMIALMLTTVVKVPLASLVPMAVITKPIQGTGASILCRMIGTLRDGIPSRMMALPANEEETEKKLFASARKGEELIVFDNITGSLYSPCLASQLTNDTFSGRILGQSVNASYPFSPLWVANGVNVVCSGDMPRRCYFIRMDPGVEKPWLKTGWRHADIENYIHAHRGEILSALLTLIRGWIRAGKPGAHPAVPVIGNYEKWTATIGGILSQTRYSRYFLGNLIESYELCDDSGDQWIEFLTGWHENFQWDEIGLATVVKVVENRDLNLAYCLPSEVSNARAKGRDLPRSLGKALHGIEGRIYSITVDTETLNSRTALVKMKSRRIGSGKKYSLVEVKAKEK